MANLVFGHPHPSSYWAITRKITGEDNVVVALEHNDRVCRIHLQEVSSSLWERNWENQSGDNQSINHLHLSLVLFSVPVGDSDTVTGKVPGGDELLQGFSDKS